MGLPSKGIERRFKRNHGDGDIRGGGNGTCQIVNLAFGGQNLLPEGLIPW